LIWTLATTTRGTRSGTPTRPGRGPDRDRDPRWADRDRDDRERDREAPDAFSRHVHPDRSPDEIREWAHEHDLPYFDDEVPFPDVRVELRKGPEVSWKRRTLKAVAGGQNA
jgi:hypothetical protein